MRKTAALGLVLGFVFALTGAAPTEDAKPRYEDGKLVRPGDYREWVFLSAGLGMTYSKNPAMPDDPMFTNVFVPQWAYQAFRKNGKWPNKTMFVVEERNSESRGSINQGGHFQTELAGIGVEVKDSSRSDQWSYYNFGSNRLAPVNPKSACWQCHEDHATVEHSFVQFYPTLKPVAEKFGTYKKAAEAPVQ